MNKGVAAVIQKLALRQARILVVIVLLVLAMSACGGGRSRESKPSELSSHTIVHDGLVRSYHLLVPSTYEEDRSTPLVLWLHGGGGNGRQMCVLRGGINEMAEEEGFIVVCPDGIEEHWNDGRDVDQWRAHAEDIDDVGFLLALIEHLSSEYNIDADRVFITGVSNGGKMSLRMACEAPHVFAAAAPVIASLPVNLVCIPSQPISILIMNGTEDPLVPWDGGEVHFLRTELGLALSTNEMVAFWVEANGCDSPPHVEQIPDLDPDDGTSITRDVYSDCDADTKVILYTVEGGGHTWPGGIQYAPEFLVGRISHDLHAGEVIWRFFEESVP